MKINKNSSLKPVSRISRYFQLTKRKKIDSGIDFEGDMMELVKFDRGGLNSIIEFYNIWQRKRNVPEDFLLLRYEDLHQSPEDNLTKLLHFLGMDNITEKDVQKAVGFAQFKT